MPETPDSRLNLVALNEALMVGALRQHELTEAAETLTARLQGEILEREQAEAALRESETRLRRLNVDLERRVLEGSRELAHGNLIDAIESLDHALILYDREDRLVLFNHHLYDQYPAADRFFVVGRTYEEIFRDLLESGTRAVPAGQSREQAIAERVAVHQRADGTILEVTLPDGRILHISDHRSRSGGFVSVGRDVTRELKLAEQLRESQKMEAIGRLTGGLAHDLNNYLAVIIGSLDLLADLPHVDPSAPGLIDSAISGAMRGAALTRSLLAFARRQPLDPKVMDIGRHIAAVIGMLKRTVGEDFEIDVQVAEGLWPVKIDGAQLDTCIVNLANNARDAMPKGGRWSISLSNQSGNDAGLDGPPMGDHVMMEFADTGTGIGEEMLGRIFEPFFSTKPPGHGTGLGLSMVHGFVHQSAGTIEVTSKPGRGTIVRIYLPRTHDGASGRAGRVGEVPVPRGHERILVVEDNQHVRATVCEQLKSLGYSVTAVGESVAALDLLKRADGDFALLFTDVVMPGEMNGRQLARMAQELWPLMAMVITSGSGEAAASADEGEEELTILQKPYRRADLARIVRDKLDRL